MNRQFWIRKSTGALLCAGAVVLVGCNNQQPPTAVAPAASSTAATAAPAGSAAQAAVPYAPPSATQLYQMVAPIALFPDKLVAQVLAGSTYPDQITSADGVVTSNPKLKGADLQTAIAQQPWDPSVKGLTAFPSVLDQMARNIDWTTALGDAYVNDPTDVMNAIQVMRARANKHGSLHNSPQMRVVTQSTTVTSDSVPDSDNGTDGGETVYSGPAVVPAPQQIIEIEPAQSDTVYVPQYDSQTVYGDEVANYPGYEYQRPREYSTGQLVGVGAVSFGVAVLVGALIEQHHDRPRANYGWNSWGMNWRDRDHGNSRGGQWQRPAVVHNNTTYVSRSTTVVNHYVTNNINNSRNVVYNHSNVNSNNQRTTIDNHQRISNQTNSNNRPVDHHDVHVATPTLANRPADIRAANTHPQAPGARRPMSMPNFAAAHHPAARPQALPTHPPHMAAAHVAAVAAHARADARDVQAPRAAPIRAPAHAAAHATAHVDRSHQPAPVMHREQPAHVAEARSIAQVRHEPRAAAPSAPRMERPRAVAIQHVRQQAPRPANHPAPHRAPAHKPEEKKHHR